MINKLNINNQLSVDDALNILHQSNCGFSYYTDPSRYVLERKDLVKLISHAYCEGYDFREKVLQDRIITIQSIGDLSDSEKLDLVARATGIITPTRDFVHIEHLSFNMDKVLAQLKENFEPDIECFDYAEDYEYSLKRYNKMIEIVKRGGTEWPFDIGDTVYCIDVDKTIYEATIINNIEIRRLKDGRTGFISEVKTRSSKDGETGFISGKLIFFKEKFGKTVFYTKPAAEAKLKELRGEEDDSMEP